MARFSFLLPSKFNNGRRVPAKLFRKIQDTLAKSFQGVTFQKNPQFKGLWLSQTQKKMILDDLMVYYVWTEHINEGRAYFQKYKEELKRLFKQEELYIIEETIEVI